MIDKDRYINILKELGSNAKLIAVSKYQSLEDIRALYDIGQRDFAENRVQSLLERRESLPEDIRWHLIGHLQTNKVKSIVSFVSMIHAVDSQKLLEAIQAEAAKMNRQMNVLLQMHVAREETKFGLDETELFEIIALYQKGNYPNIQLCGMMGMATNSDDESIVSNEFAHIQALFSKVKMQLNNEAFCELSIGMSGDYRIALKHGATMIRVGSLLFLK
ncbi:MAG: YggS family pyridoxal phosphate-dependent enzyme [Bacteroidetes bacterium]|nr:YggS family pyridoxal phosphate-dependent enzyme [Bacteroidota bacterium]